MSHRIRLVAAAALLVAVACLGPATVAAAGDQTTTSTTTSTTGAAPAPAIIPEPNQGREPEDAGDRGGALQTVLFVAIIAGVVGIGVLVARESRRARERRGF